MRREGGEVMTEGAATVTCLPPPHTIDYVAESWRRRRVARTLNGPRVAGFVTTSAWLWLKSRSVFTHDRIDDGEGQQHGRGRPCYEASRRRRRTAGPTLALAHPGLATQTHFARLVQAIKHLLFTKHSSFRSEHLTRVRHRDGGH